MVKVQELMKLIAARPMIRTVEIADLVDCEVDEVEPALSQFIREGSLVRHLITAPNGKPANAFEFSAAFKKLPAFQALLPAPDAPGAGATDMPAGAGQGSTSPEKVPPSDSDKTASEKPYADMAVEYIKSKPNGLATTSELIKALGLAPGEYPSNVLGYAVRKGRLVSKAQTWSLGEHPDVVAPGLEVQIPVLGKKSVTIEVAAPAAAVATSPWWASTEGILVEGGRRGLLVRPGEPVSEFRDRVQQEIDAAAHPAPALAAAPPRGDAPAAATEAPTPSAPLPPPAQPAAVAPVAMQDAAQCALEVPEPVEKQAGSHEGEPTAVNSVGTFRCAYWSDGEVELQRDGMTVLKLVPTEIDKLERLMSAANFFRLSLK